MMKVKLLAVMLTALVAGAAQGADPATIDWSKIAANNVTLFYPGQSSYEWVRSAAHPGAAMVATGGARVVCHSAPDVEKSLGDKLVKAGLWNPRR
jgi:hypothetical protein